MRKLIFLFNLYVFNFLQAYKKLFYFFFLKTLQLSLHKLSIFHLSLYKFL